MDVIFQRCEMIMVGVVEGMCEKCSVYGGCLDQCIYFYEMNDSEFYCEFSDGLRYIFF